MISRQPIASDDEHRVLKFRPRASETLRTDAVVPVETEEPDDFRHQMWTNAAALAFTAALVAFGIWLAVSMSESRKAQDCVLMGRRDCAQLSARAKPPLAKEPLARDH